MTFQDDLVAFRDRRPDELATACAGPTTSRTPTRRGRGARRCSTEQTDHLTDEQRRAILCDNVAELYGIDTSKLPVGGDILAASAA